MLIKKAIIKKAKVFKKKVSSRPQAKKRSVSGRSGKKKAVLLKSARQAKNLPGPSAEDLKYSPDVNQPSFRKMPPELPKEYGQDKITVLVRDPRWIYTYWEITPNTIKGLRKQLGVEFYRVKTVLRVYDVTSINFNGSNARSSFDLPVEEYVNNRYIEIGASGKSFCVDLGYLLPGGKFLTIVRSNIVRMPLEGASNITDEEWMVPDEIFARLYGMGFGLGRSSPIGKNWQERVKYILSSRVPGSAGVASRYYLHPRI